jgi:hypothetical protein
MAKDKTDTAPEVAPLVAPFSTEDPSRGVAATGKAPVFAGFPKNKYHPVYGLRVIADPNEEATLMPKHNWFDTAEEADAHRTEREAQQVIHYNARVRVDGALNGSAPTTMDDKAVTGEEGIVRNSVAATESLKSGFAEPL